MVQFDKVQKIRANWEAAGRPECLHETVDKEYYLSDSTGDFICLSCGETFSRSEWKQIRETSKRN
ncbi:hypothetical protein NicSoilC12_14150 [Arthrobacter sp. NicSoilC12]|nr:hypothetical protein NicSoilC12_14150 [Arthrobacter sp. NicSoilC12]